MRYNKEQKASIRHWIKGSLVGAFGIITAWAIYPLAWVFRHKGKKSWFWWWMDDERILEDGSYAPDYEAYIKLKGGTKETFRISYNWHNRNSVWNLRRSKFLVNSTPAEVGNNNIEVVKIVTDNYFKFNEDGSKTRLPQDGIWIIDAGLKYVPVSPDLDPWQVNGGDTISYYTSILGEGMMWFRPTGKKDLMFRYSHCKIVEYKIFGIRIWKGWRTLKLGYGNMSYLATIKHQPIKPWG